MNLTIKLLAVICVVSIILIFVDAPVGIVAFFVSMPIAVGIMFLLPDIHPVYDYIELFGQCHMQIQQMEECVNKAIKQVNSFIKLKKVLDDVSLVNFRSFAFKEYAATLCDTEKKFSVLAGKLYSKMRVCKAKGEITTNDYAQMLKMLSVNQQMINAIADLIDQIVDTNDYSTSIDNVNDLIGALKIINKKYE